MKKIKSLFTLVLLFILIYSCSSDGKSEPSIYHRWPYKERTIDGVSYSYSYNGCNGEYIEFYGANKVQIVVIVNCEKNILASGTFTKHDNVITTTTKHLSNPPHTTTYYITELTQNTLTLWYGDYFVDENGMIVPYNQDKFER